jgi:HD-GYP domain-containing protein (c-di-GMP phosphodiesterase class II)/GNAT superfamily N-acetyltransferase
MISGELGVTADAALALHYAALLHDIGISNEYILLDHCKIGSAMLAKLPLPDEIPEFVLYHHEFYDGSGLFGKAGPDIPLGAQIISFASAFDDMFGKMTDSFHRALFLSVNDWLNAAESMFSGEIVAAFKKLIKQEFFLLDYFNQETRHTRAIPSEDGVVYGYEDVLKFALCFADIIDRRSPFTYTHSKGIAEYARAFTKHLGYGTDKQNEMYIAGLLHDVGKLHVSTDILHKAGKLTPDERFEINKHTYYTRKILEPVAGLEEIMNYGANHHERLDGLGYPYRMPGAKLSELERVMAVCDVYQALTEKRPYRESLASERVFEIMDGMVEKNHLDGRLVEKFKEMEKTVCFLRYATAEDVDSIEIILNGGREYLREQGLTQWQNGNGPTRKTAEQDIARSEGFVFENGSIQGYAALISGVDDVYTGIYDGAWHECSQPYISIHRVALSESIRGKGQGKAFMDELIAEALREGFHDIRIDTHSGNEIMQRVISDAGFTYRGKVLFPFEDGERLAYQLLR